MTAEESKLAAASHLLIALEKAQPDEVKHHVASVLWSLRYSLELQGRGASADEVARLASLVTSRPPIASQFACDRCGRMVTFQTALHEAPAPGPIECQRCIRG